MTGKGKNRELTIEEKKEIARNKMQVGAFQMIFKRRKDDGMSNEEAIACAIVETSDDEMEKAIGGRGEKIDEYCKRYKLTSPTN
jgi:hypothetical protein